VELETYILLLLFWFLL